VIHPREKRVERAGRVTASISGGQIIGEGRWWGHSRDFFWHQGVREECRASLSLLERTIYDIPTGGEFQEFLYAIDTHPVFMDHFPQAFDPLEIAHGKVSPGALASGADETGILIVAKGPGMNVEHFGRHADGKESFVFLHFWTSSPGQPGRFVTPLRGQFS
jgi:hypothetical protein